MKQFCLNIVGTGGTGVAGATLSWTDGTAKTATADGTGFYQFPVSYDWSGTVTPSLAGYTFTNPSTTYSHVLANQQANYTAAAVAIAISGNAGVAGATLSWTDGSANTVTASGTGAYTLIVPYNWSGTVTPSLAGYGFTSSSTLYTNILTNQTTNYTATITGYAIGGSVTAGSAIAYAGTTTGTLAGSATAGGTFVLNLPIGWTGTVTATLAGYTFPTSTVAPLAANLTLNLPGNSGDLASFAFLKANNPALAADDFGVISGNTILVKVPVGLAVTSLVATYVTSGSSVLIAGIPQTSGTTANNFTSPLVYVVQPRGVNYTVTVAPGALSVIGTYVNATGAPQAFFINNGTRIPLNLPAMTGASKLYRPRLIGHEFSIRQRPWRATRFWPRPATASEAFPGATLGCSAPRRWPRPS